MKKLFFSAMLLIAASASVKAQDDMAFNEGQSSVSLGYGFLNPYKSLFKVTSLGGLFGGPSTKFSALGPIGVTYEYGISEKISIGGQVAYATMKNVSTTVNGISAGKDYISTEKLNQLSVILRGNYHFGKGAKFDPYAGLGLGYGNFKYSVSDNDNNTANNNLFNISVPGAFGFTGQLGAKYYFSDNIGAFAEIGYLAGSFAQVGVSFKF
jgi:outer membrane protein W